MCAEDIKTVDELWSWFEANSRTAKECFVPVKWGKTQEANVVSYSDAVEVAIAFGWIDSTCRAYGNGLRLQRFSPRKKGGSWTELNKARANRLIALGKMTEDGFKALAFAKEFVIDEEVKTAFEANPIALANFQSFPPLYRRVRIDTVQMYKKKDRAQFERRLKKLIEFSERGEMFGEWNDGDKLID